MLLPVKTTALAALTALAVGFTPASPALAWGDKEQGVLAGILGTIAIQGLIRETGPSHRPAPVYRDPPRQPVYQQPVYEEPAYYQPRATTSIYRTPAAKAFQSYSTSERRLIQRRLASYGYYRGGIDGSFGPGTYSAITAYASDQGETSALRSTSGAFGVYDGLIF